MWVREFGFVSKFESCSCIDWTLFGRNRIKFVNDYNNIFFQLVHIKLKTSKIHSISSTFINIWNHCCNLLLLFNSSVENYYHNFSDDTLVNFIVFGFSLCWRDAPIFVKKILWLMPQKSEQNRKLELQNKVNSWVRRHIGCKIKSGGFERVWWNENHTFKLIEFWIIKNHSYWLLSYQFYHILHLLWIGVCDWLSWVWHILK